MKQQEQMPLAYSGKYIDYKIKDLFFSTRKITGWLYGL